jgi:hypothetical protein
MFRQYSFCFVMVLLVACGRVENKKVEPGLPGSSFVEETQLDTNDTSRFSVGCKSPGVPYGPTAYRLDSRLKPGMGATISVAAFDESGTARRVVYRTNVTSVGSKKFVTENRILSTAGLSANDLPATTTIDCSEGQASISCINLAFRLVIDKEVNAPTETCNVEDLVRETQLWKGRFTLSDQSQTVPAFRVRNRWIGKIKCGNQVREQGERAEEIFYSNETPGIQFGFANCGGEKLFEKSILRNLSDQLDEFI